MFVRIAYNFFFFVYVHILKIKLFELSFINEFIIFIAKCDFN